eukprot:gene8793-1168_t
MDPLPLLHAPVLPMTHQGRLIKLGYKSGKWQQRWFILTGNLLSYSNMLGSQPKCVVMISGTSVVSDFDEASPISQDAIAPGVIIKSSIPKNAFKLKVSWKGKIRTFYLCAPSPEERKVWIKQQARQTSQPIEKLTKDMVSSNNEAPAPMPVAIVSNNVEQRPVPSVSTQQSLPRFPEIPQTNMLGMLGTAFGMMSTVKSHRNDPHLSTDDNATLLAQRLDQQSGVSHYDTQLLHVSNILARDFLPDGLSGIVVTRRPKPGTLGHSYGLKPYDLLYQLEGQAVNGVEQFTELRKQAFGTKGNCTFGVYNFADRQYREVCIVIPPGKPNAILGVDAVPVPPPSSEELAEKRKVALSEVYVKGWRQHGAMFISAGQQYFPLSSPQSDADRDVLVKIWRPAGRGVMINTNQYHPLYAYEGDPQVYTEGWRLHGRMYVSVGQKYVALPPR